MNTSTALLSLSAKPNDPVADLRSAVVQRLGELLPPACGPDDLVRLAMREGLLGPGKRIRPMLLLLTARSFGLDAMDLVDAACALEMVHTASLFLDDLPCMDDALERRGKPALHLQFGEDVAVLAAVALLSQAFRVVAASPGMPPLVRTRAVAALADAIGPGGLVHGQFRDLRDTAVAGDEASLANINHLKTASLFKAAVEIASLAANAPAPAAAQLYRFAAELGQAFQLRDDLEDGIAGPQAPAVDAGKPTLLALLGARATRRRFDDCMERAVECLDQLFPHDRSLVQAIIPMMGWDSMKSDQLECDLRAQEAA